MRKRIHKILVTGGAGFIGSAFVRLTVKNGYKVIIIDRLSYAGDLKRIEEVKNKIHFYKTDICDKKSVECILKKEKPDAIVNFAAETHVDRSILDSGEFLKTNVMGTQNLLDCARKFKLKRFIHISTDEVYGEIVRGSFTEKFPLKPNSPYAASKAAADLLIKSYIRTYNFPAIIIRPSNNYGPWQYPEKLIPLSILKLLRKEKIPIYAKGRNVREWLYVDDCVIGVLKVLEKGKIGEVYNLGSQEERENINVVKKITKLFNLSFESIEYVKDRLGHDIRYSLDSKKITKDVGFRPKIKLDLGLKKTVEWCLEHKGWLLKKWKNISPLYK